MISYDKLGMAALNNMDSPAFGSELTVPKKVLPLTGWSC